MTQRSALNKLIKQFVTHDLGFKGTRVKGGTGTAYFWVYVTVPGLPLAPQQANGKLRYITEEIERKFKDELTYFYGDGPDETKRSCLRVERMWEGQ